MLDLRRLRLLRELKERGTIAAVADALQFTPSAVSQQLAMLEREAGVRLLERAGRVVRLTDPALVLVEHAVLGDQRGHHRIGRAEVLDGLRGGGHRVGSASGAWARHVDSAYGTALAAGPAQPPPIIPRSPPRWPTRPRGRPGRARWERPVRPPPTLETG